MCWFGMVLVHRPRTNNVLAMYWVSTSPLAPSDTTQRLIQSTSAFSSIPHYSISLLPGPPLAQTIGGTPQGEGTLRVTIAAAWKPNHMTTTSMPISRMFTPVTGPPTALRPRLAQTPTVWGQQHASVKTVKSACLAPMLTTTTLTVCT
jgi:hypothetical protein